MHTPSSGRQRGSRGPPLQRWGRCSGSATGPTRPCATCWAPHALCTRPSCSAPTCWPRSSPSWRITGCAEALRHCCAAAAAAGSSQLASRRPRAASDSGPGGQDLPMGAGWGTAADAWLRPARDAAGSRGHSGASRAGCSHCAVSSGPGQPIWAGHFKLRRGGGADGPSGPRRGQQHCQGWQAPAALRRPGRAQQPARVR